MKRKAVHVHHLYVFERDGKFYDPTCRVIEVENGHTMRDVEAWVKHWMNTDKYPVQLSEHQTPDGVEVTITQHEGDKERFKLVPFDSTKQYKRHKA